MKRVENKVILVTGGAMGMGRSHSELLAAQGAWVFVADVNAAEGQATVDSIRKNGGKADFLQLDVTQEAQWNAALAQITERAGRLDVLVNNAGILILKPMQDTTNDEWDRVFDVNVRGLFIGTRAAVPLMQKAGGGTIVNVSSIATRGIHRMPYSAAKGGVNAVTQSLAMELADRNIRVVATAPGGTEAPPRRIPRNAAGDTAEEKAWMAEVVTQVKQSSFMKRYATIEEQAAPILFLASDEASYITGSIMPVAGGDLG